MQPLSPPIDIQRTVEAALAEDIGSGDITAALIPEHEEATAELFAREQAVLCGIPWVVEIFNQLDPTVQIQWRFEDGEKMEDGQVIATFSGKARSLLTAERCALNFLQTLSATATRSQQFASLVSHTKVKLLDTRKTLPGLRTAQKYAVKAGGCFNHRFGLYDAYLIKENHINACGSIELAVTTARKLNPQRPIEVEVESMSQLKAALKAQVEVIMLDNFTLEQLSEAVQLNAGRAKLEASGGISNETLIAVAETGVDYISLGTLTKDCKAVDLSLIFA